MANGYFQTGLADRICYFDVFYRSVPDKGGFAPVSYTHLVEYLADTGQLEMSCQRGVALYSRPKG